MISAQSWRRTPHPNQILEWGGVCSAAPLQTAINLHFIPRDRGIHIINYIKKIKKSISKLYFISQTPCTCSQWWFALEEPCMGDPEHLKQTEPFPSLLHWQLPGSSFLAFCLFSNANFASPPFLLTPFPIIPWIINTWCLQTFMALQVRKLGGFLQPLRPPQIREFIIQQKYTLKWRLFFKISLFFPAML